MESFPVLHNPGVLGFLGWLPNELMCIVWSHLGQSLFPFDGMRYHLPENDEIRAEARAHRYAQLSQWPALHPAHVGVVLQQFRVILRGRPVLP